MSRSTTRHEDEEPTELPGKEEDTSVHMRELKEYKDKELSGEEQKDTAEEGIDREPSQRVESHPHFWFIWEEMPGEDNSEFLKRFQTITGYDWIINTQVEKSTDGSSMIVVSGGNLAYLEIHGDVGALVVSDRAGKPFLELTARKLDGRTFCFSTILCNRKLMNGPVCMNPALPGTRRCREHTVNEGRPAGQRRLIVTSVTTGVSCLPTDAMYYWSKKKPEIVQFIRDMAESFRLKLNWDPQHPLMDELRYIAVQMVTRNMMHNKSIEADFKSAIHDPDTGNVVAFKAHFLLDKVTTFDARIQQKLKDFGLLIPPSRTEEPHRIPVELEFLWTPIKKVPAIEVQAKEVGPEGDKENEDKKEDE